MTHIVLTFVFKVTSLIMPHRIVIQRYGHSTDAITNYYRFKERNLDRKAIIVYLKV